MISSRLPTAGLIMLGLAEQAVSSASTFLFVIFLAASLDAQQLGAFSVAWAVVYLVESMLWNLLGEPVPAAAFRIPKSKWGRMRTGLLLLTLMAIAALFAMVIAAALLAIQQPETSAIILAGGLAAIGLRCQQFFKRICYLDQLRVLSLAAACVFASVLLASCALAAAVGWLNPVSALLCWSISSISSSSLLLTQRQKFATASVRVTVWLLKRLLSSGRWLVGSAMLFWITNMSIIPLSGYLFGLEVAGAFRLIQTLFSPLQQGTLAVMTVLTPRIAQSLRYSTPKKIRSSAISMSLLLGALAVGYGTLAVVAGPVVLTLVFPQQAYLLGSAMVLVFALSAVFEALRSALSAVLISIHAPRALLWSRLVGAAFFLLSLAVALPLGTVALPLALLVSSAIGYVLVVGSICATLAKGRRRTDLSP